MFENWKGSHIRTFLGFCKLPSSNDRRSLPYPAGGVEGAVSSPVGPWQGADGGPGSEAP